MQVESDWRTPLIDYINKEMVREDEKEAKQLLKKATGYTMVEGHFFGRGVSIPLMKCIGHSEVWYVLTEIHKRRCRHHVKAKSLTRKVLRAG